MARIPGPNGPRKPEEVIALRDLSRATPNFAERLESMDVDRLQSIDDRAMAIIDSADLERSLERALESRMRPLSKAEFRNIFVGENAPLVSFSAKTKIAHAFGLIGPRTVSELDKIRTIRNQFAHSPKPISFKTHSVKACCATLETPERDTFRRTNS